MCGISFFCSKKNFNKELELSTDSISHRGPDAKGIETFKVNDFFVGFGHRRLSIIDLSSNANQPFRSGKNSVIIFNGEIYNFKELRAGLQKNGKEFITRSDTEVIIELYDEYGVESFSMLNGIFAFIIFDQSRNKILIVRDFLGVKPLYFYQDELNFFASSEIKGLKIFKDIDFKEDKDDIYEFFNTGNLYEPNTGFLNIKKIFPGSYLEIDLEKFTFKEKSFKFLRSKKKENGLEESISNAINRQQISDVPVGLFFSAGVDSSLLAFNSKIDKLIFAKYEEDSHTNKDHIYSKIIQKYLKKELIQVNLPSVGKSRDEILRRIDNIAINTEELIADYTFFASYELSKKASEIGYKVVLSGMGADEIFAGYPRYLIVKFDKFFRFVSQLMLWLSKVKLYPKFLDKKIDRLVAYSTEKNWYLAYCRLLGYFSSSELESLFKDGEELKEALKSRFKKREELLDINPNNKVEASLKIDRYGFLSRNLMVADKSSMLAGIEMRVPFLDYELVNISQEFKSNSLIKGIKLKYPLKKILSKFIPNRLINRTKVGFNPPLDKLIDVLGKNFILNILESDWATFNKIKVIKIVEDHFNGIENNSYKIWQLIYFVRWKKAHLHK